MDTTREVRKEKTNLGSGNVVVEKTTSGPNREQRHEARKETGIFQARYMVYYILGVLEILLMFRLGLKLLGANPASGFVSFIYSVTNIFLFPFAAIFHTTATQGIETAAVLEPSVLIAILVYAIIGWGVAQLINVLLTGKR